MNPAKFIVVGVVIGVPLAYQYLTSLRPDALPATADDVLRMRARGWRPTFPVGSQDIGPGLPLVNAFHWDTGVEGHWAGGRLDLAAALTRGAPAVAVLGGHHDGPEVSGRAAVTAAALIAPTLSASTAGAARTISSSLASSNAELVMLTVSPACGALGSDDAAPWPAPVFAPSVRRAPEVSKGLKPWPLIRSVMAITPAHSRLNVLYRRLRPQL